MQDEIDNLTHIIDEITEELRLTHLREAVLKRRLNKAIDEKCTLIEEERSNRTRATNTTRSNHRTPGTPVFEETRANHSNSGNRNIPTNSNSPNRNPNSLNSSSSSSSVDRATNSRTSVHTSRRRNQNRPDSSSSGVNQSTENRSTAYSFRGKGTTRRSTVVRDRDGATIDVGDEVRFLTGGVNLSNFGEVYKITQKFVHCIDNNNESTKRYPRNLRIVNKFHEC